MALIAAIFIAVFIARKKRSPAAGHAKMDDGGYTPGGGPWATVPPAHEGR